MKGILDFTQLIAIVTGAISLVGILIVQYFSIRENRTTRYSNIITKQTLVNNMFIRENSEILTLMTRPDIIDEFRKSGELFEYKKVLLRAEINMEHQFYHGLSQDRDLINVIRELTSQALIYYHNPSSDVKTVLMQVGNRYYNLMTLYDYSDWIYIKRQAEKKAYDVKYERFDKIYKEEQKKLKEEDEKYGALKRWEDLLI